MAMPIWPLALSALAICATGASAGTTADSRILGFTPNGDVFAFEEFGIQDGSGFPFSTIYVIDTKSDAWVPGTPFRVRIDEDSAPLSKARAQARQQAAPLLGKIVLEDRALTLAASPLGEFGADPVRLGFGEPLPSNPLADITRRYEASLDIYYADSPGQDCVTYIGDRPQAFRLKIRNLSSGTEAVLHEDSQIPASRGCPITYRISEVVVPDSYPANTVVVLISVFTPGFEGPDRRFLAVSGALPQ
jgi:predicted secreted protein